MKATLVREESTYFLVVPAEKIHTSFYSPSHTDNPLEDTLSKTERKLLHGIGPLVYGLYTLQPHERLRLAWSEGHATIICTDRGIFYAGDILSDISLYEGVSPFMLMVDLIDPTQPTAEKA